MAVDEQAISGGIGQAHPPAAGREIVGQPRRYWPRLPILAGPLRGLWYLPGAGGAAARILLGGYEPPGTDIFGRVIEPGDCVWDLGAHIGYYTLLAARLTGPAGRVLAIEPLPRNCERLKQHVAVNGCRTVTVLQAAAGDAEGTASFDPGEGNGRGYLSHSGTLDVRVVHLDDIAAELGCIPAFIKMDVEGAERRVLEGSRELLATSRPVLLISTHGHQVKTECVDFLKLAGYEVERIRGAGLLACHPAGRSL